MIKTVVISMAGWWNGLRIEYDRCQKGVNSIALEHSKSVLHMGRNVLRYHGNILGTKIYSKRKSVGQRF